MGVVAVVVGVVLVLSVLADLINTLVTTQVTRGRYWLTRIAYTRTWSLVRFIGQRVSAEHKERLYSTFAPVSVLVLLGAWVTQQVVGFGLIWWGIGGVDGADSLVDSIYYSGVVYFTLGFGEIVPADVVPRFGALLEAFAGVLTTALVIGYLPSLYGAYSQREQKLSMLDDGSEERITPTNLVLARCPDGDPRQLDSFFEEWEAWVAQVLETHTTFPMLVLFRSQHRGQHWLTALGVVTDAALHMEMVEDGHGRAPYWFLRRSMRLFDHLTTGIDVSGHRARLDSVYDDDPELLRGIYDDLAAHGFRMRPFEEAVAQSRELRVHYDAQMEALIEALDAPHGFWGHEVGHRLARRDTRAPDHRLGG